MLIIQGWPDFFDRRPNLKKIASRAAQFKKTHFKIIISAKQEKNGPFDAF